MADKERMCGDMTKRVLRQYDYIQTNHRPPTTIEDLELEDVVITFKDFVVHVLS